jgi:RimJ/RimL family protein N-acetyltransferase
MSARPDSTGATCSAWDNSECGGTPYCPPRCPRFEGKDGTPYVARPFREGDRSALVSMYADLDRFSRANGLPPINVPQIESWLDRLLENGWNLVVVDGSEVVGHVAAVPVDSAAPEFVIFVHQDHQNNAVGTELVKQLIAYADERDHEGLTLEVSTGNERAITVYENVGFEVTKEKLSEIEMELDLDGPLAERLQRPPAERE